MVDPYFRKHILVQFLIIIQYLESHTANAKDTYAKLRNPNKSLQPHWVMEDKDQEWATLIKPRIFKELKATGEESGDNGFLRTVNAVLNHEESWVRSSCHTRALSNDGMTYKGDVDNSLTPSECRTPGPMEGRGLFIVREATTDCKGYRGNRDEA